jgi:hypothetical protein
MRVFLSYRRGDAAAYAGRLTDALIQLLGPKSVFQDVSTVTPGQDFTVEIDRALADSDVALVVIGPGWVTAETTQGTRRLLDTNDYVRLEVSKALSSDIRVIPVLVGGAQLPTRADLPADLQELTQRQAVGLHDETWHRDVEGLVRALRGQPAVSTSRRHRWLAAGTAAVILVALGVGGWFLWGPGTGASTSSGSDSLPPCTAPASPDWTKIAVQKNTFVYNYEGTQLTYTVTGAHWRSYDGKWQVILNTTLENDTNAPINIGPYDYSDLVVAKRPFSATCFRGSSTRQSGLTDDELVGYEDISCEPSGRIFLEIDGAKGILVTPDELEWGTC